MISIMLRSQGFRRASRVFGLLLLLGWGECDGGDVIQDSADTDLWANGHLVAENYDLAGVWKLGAAPDPAVAIYPLSHDNFYGPLSVQSDNARLGADTLTLERIGTEVEDTFSSRTLRIRYRGTLMHRHGWGGLGRSRFISVPFPGGAAKFAATVPSEPCFVEEHVFDVEGVLTLDFFKADGRVRMGSVDLRGQARGVPQWFHATNVVLQAQWNDLGTFGTPGGAPLYQDQIGNTLHFNRGVQFASPGRTPGEAPYRENKLPPGSLNLEDIDPCGYYPGGPPGDRTRTELGGDADGATRFSVVVDRTGDPLAAQLNRIIRVYPLIWHRQGNAGVATVGVVKGKLVDRVNQITIKRGKVRLFDQQEAFRPMLPGEKESDYLHFMELFLRQGRPVAETQVLADGSFEFRGLPISKDVDGAPAAVIYAIGVSRAEADVTFDPANPVVYYRDRFQADFPVGDGKQASTPVLLDASVFTATKRSLAVRLSGLATNNFAPVERSILDYLDRVEGGAIPLTAAREEGIQRGAWAERASLEGAEQARVFLKDMLENLATLVNTALDAWMSNKESRGRQGKKFIDEVRKGGTDPLNVTDFKVPPGTPEAVDLLVKDGLAYEFFGMIEKAIDTMGALTASALKFSGMSTARADGVSKALVFVGKGIVAYRKSQAMLGRDSHAPNAAFVRILVDSFGSVLFDNTFSIDLTSVPGQAHLASWLSGGEVREAKLALGTVSAVPSYAKSTAPFLTYGANRIPSWSQADPEAYRRDALLAADHVEMISRRGTELRRDLIYLSAISKTAASAGAVFSVGADLTENPYLRAASVATKVVQALSNAALFERPANHVFYQLPAMVSKATALAFGEESLPAAAAVQGTAGESVEVPRWRESRLQSGGAPDERQSAELAAFAAFTNRIDGIRSGLVTNDLGAVLRLMNAGTPTYSQAARDFQRAAGALTTQGRAMAATNLTAARGLTGLVETEARILLAADAFHFQIVEILGNALTRGYRGASDPAYLRARNVALGLAANLLADVREHHAALDAWYAPRRGRSTAPLLLASFDSVVSEATGKSVMRLTNEIFTVQGRIANVSVYPASNLTARLLMAGPGGAWTLLTPESVDVGTGGVLVARDGEAGAGADESAATWRVQYSGPLDLLGTVFKLEVIENHELPTSVQVDAAILTLFPDREVTDPDNDGMPTAYERLFGLDPNRDDAREDRDGDGLLNQNEYRRGTRPDLADSDGDGVSDGDEVSGARSLFRTEPLIADTDGDGVRDGADLQPVDARNSSVLGWLGRPLVTLGTDYVRLGPEIPATNIVVALSQAGIGGAAWEAWPEREGVVVLSPRAGSGGESGIPLTISLLPGYDYAATAETRMRILFRAVGAPLPAARYLTVVVDGGIPGPIEPPRFLGIQSDSGGVTVRIGSDPGATVELQASPDLKSWSVVGAPTQVVGTSVSFRDSGAGTVGVRFYRAVRR